MKTMNSIRKALSLLLALVLFLTVVPSPARAAEEEGTACTHEFTPTVFDPTCTEEGYTLYTCVHCGQGYYDDYTDPLGHDYAATVVDSTCTEDGYTLYKCTRCIISYSETIPAGHDIVTTVVAPTCTKDGYTVYTCTKCDGVFYGDPVNAVGHSYTSTVVAPTCAAYGYTLHTCTACGDSYQTDSVPPVGHNFVSTTFRGETTLTCTTCQYSFVQKSADVTYNKVSKFTAGESYVIAVYNGRTAYALSHAGNRLSAVKITISGGKVTSDVTDGMLWDYASGKLSYNENGTTYYLRVGPTSAGNGYFTLDLSTTVYSSVSFSSNKLKVGSCYLRYNGGTIKGYRSGSTTYLMEETE